MKGYTKISLFGVSCLDLIKLNQEIEKNNWKITHHKEFGKIYSLVPNRLIKKVEKILQQY